MTSPGAGPGVPVVVLYADGAGGEGTGPAGFAALVTAPDSGAVLAKRSGPLREVTATGAGYRALAEGLAEAARLGAREVEVRMHAHAILAQMSGRSRIRAPELRALAAQVATRVRGFDAVRYVPVPAADNEVAARLARLALRGADRAARGSWEPRSATPTRLYLVRHGQTEYTAQGRYSGRIDVPLSGYGLAQADAVAARLSTVAGPVAVVATSPLARCAQTAARIAARVGGPPVLAEPDLIECDFGQWDGLTFAEVRARFPDQVARWLASSAVAPPGGEALRSVGVRARRALGRLRDGYPGASVVVVTHVGPIKALLRDALDAGPQFVHRLHLDPAGVSIVDTWPDGGVSVRLVNDTAHLAEPAPGRTG